MKIKVMINLAMSAELCVNIVEKIKKIYSVRSPPFFLLFFLSFPPSFPSLFPFPPRRADPFAPFLAVPVSFWTVSEVLTHYKRSEQFRTRSEHIPNEIKEFQTRSERGPNKVRTLSEHWFRIVSRDRGGVVIALESQQSYREIYVQLWSRSHSFPPHHYRLGKKVWKLD